MADAISKDVLSNILKAYISEETLMPTSQVIKELAAAAGVSEQAVKNEYEKIYKSAGNDDDPFGPIGAIL